MKRIILFRGKSYRGKWVYDNYLPSIVFREDCINDGPFDFESDGIVNAIQIGPNTIDQYTD